MQAQLQLLLLGILNIVTDVMLLILPWPLLGKLRLQWHRKAQLSALFMLGIFIIAITAVRLPINDLHISSQVSRTTWASAELFTAAVVVNGATFYGLYSKQRRQRLSSDMEASESTWITPTAPSATVHRRAHPNADVSTHNLDSEGPNSPGRMPVLEIKETRSIVISEGPASNSTALLDEKAGSSTEGQHDRSHGPHPPRDGTSNG